MRKTKKQPAVRLELAAPSATHVMVAGTFNDWNTQATPMARDDGGRWRVALALPPGRYEYKFLVDGVWCCEVGADGPCERGDGDCVPNPFGTHNRVLEHRG